MINDGCLNYTRSNDYIALLWLLWWCGGCGGGGGGGGDGGGCGGSNYYVIIKHHR